jgi:hypothetical protein
MDRRNALIGTAALAVSVGHGWVARALAQAADAPPGESPLDRAVLSARALGKPVLVLVVPDEGPGRLELGIVFGELLELGGDALLADLALVEVACATRVQLRRAAGRECAGDLGLLELEGELPRWTAIDFVVDLFTPEGSVRTPMSRTALLARLEDAVRSAIGSGPAALDARAEVARAALSPKLVSRLESAITLRTRLPIPTVDAGAALLRAAAERSEKSRDFWLPRLAHAATVRMVAAAPHGAVWELPRHPCAGGPCGTGSFSFRSRRFLRYYLEG